MAMLRKKLRNIRYTAEALTRMWREERSFRIQIWSVVPFLLLAVFFHIRALEWAIISFACFMLVAVEFVNTAFERIGDAVTEKHDSRVGSAKELASAATFVTGTGLAIIFTVVLVPHFLNVLAHF